MIKHQKLSLVRTYGSEAKLTKDGRQTVRGTFVRQDGETKSYSNFTAYGDVATAILALAPGAYGVASYLEVPRAGKNGTPEISLKGFKSIAKAQAEAAA